MTRAGISRVRHRDHGIAYRFYGDPSGEPVLALHGTPGSHSKFAIADATAAKLGLRLIAVDRWGYGGSDRPRTPSLPLFADAMRALLDDLDLERVAVIGVSGGGPYAVAVAAGLGNRVSALALVAPVGPIAGSHVPVRLDPVHAACFRVLPALPGTIRLGFAAFRMLLARSDRVALAIATARAGPSDRAIVADPAVRATLAHCCLAGLAPGLHGPVIDMQLFGRPWGLELSQIVAPTRIWIGDEDRNVPREAVDALAAAIPGAELIPLPGAGHLWIMRNASVPLQWLPTACRNHHVGPQ